MGGFGNTGNLKDGQIEEIRKLFEAALADGRLGNKESAQIQIFYYQSALSAAEFDALKSDVFREVVEKAIADERVTEQEEKSIFRIAEQLSVAPEWKDWARQQIGLYSPAASAAASSENG